MLLEQYMTPVNIIIAVILVVLGYLAYKKYQKSSGSYEHVEPLGNDQTNYTLVKTTIKSDIYIAPEINSIIKKFDKDPQQLGDVLHKFSIRIGSQSYSNIIEIKLYLDPESLYKTKINYKRTGPIEIAKKVNINNFPSINVGITVNGDNIAINKRVTKTKDKYTSSGLEFDISSEINKMVASGELDFGAVMNPLPIQGLVTRFIGEDDVHVWESKDRYQDKLIYNPELMQSRSIISRWKECPGETVEVSNLELIASLVHSGAGYGILPAQVVKSQRLNLRIVEKAPNFKDKLAIVCYPEMLKTTEGKLIFENLKRSFQN